MWPGYVCFSRPHFLSFKVEKILALAVLTVCKDQKKNIKMPWKLWNAIHLAETLRIPFSLSVGFVGDCMEPGLHCSHLVRSPMLGVCVPFITVRHAHASLSRCFHMCKASWTPVKGSWMASELGNNSQPYILMRPNILVSFRTVFFFLMLDTIF